MTTRLHYQAAYTKSMLQPFHIGHVKPTSSSAGVLSMCPPPAAAAALPCPALPCPALPCPALPCCGSALLPANRPSSLCQPLQSSEPLPQLFFVPDRSPTWSFENQKDIRKRPPGPVQQPQKDAVSDPQGFLGISKAFGFTKRNEVSKQC